MRSSSPKVTVIIPIYNVEKYLTACIKSVRRQTLQEFEVICVNDGSTDRSRDIAILFARRDDRIKIIDQENSGASVARNIAMKYAKGEYIYFLDADDYIEQSTLDKLYTKAKKEKLDIVLFNGEPIYDNKSLEQSFDQYKQYYRRKSDYPESKRGKELLLEMMKNGDYKVSCCLQMFRREFLVYQELKFQEGIMHEDNLFTLSAMVGATKVGYINEVLFYRRVHSNSVSTKPVTSKNAISSYECMKGVRRVRDTIVENNELRSRLTGLSLLFKNRVTDIIKVLDEEESNKVKEYMEEDEAFGISVITATNKKEQLNFLLDNYLRQKLRKKELILVLNKDEIELDKVRERVKDDSSIHVYQLPEECTLGECLNYGVSKMKYHYVAKVDDDDYYGEEYLREIAETFRGIDCDIVGKSKYYAYLQADDCLCNWYRNRVNTYVRSVAGGTICCKKEVVERVPFPKQKVGTDFYFLKAAGTAGYKMYSTSVSNYLYMRYRDMSKHTWKITSDYYTGDPRCRVLEGMRLENIIRNINDMSVYE